MTKNDVCPFAVRKMLGVIEEVRMSRPPQYRYMIICIKEFRKKTGHGLLASKFAYEAAEDVLRGKEFLLSPEKR